MKKIIVLILLLAGAAGAVFYYVQYSAAPAAGSDYYADYLSLDIVAAITLIDAHGMTKAFPESALGKFFAKPTIRAILREQGAAEESLKKYDDLYDGVAELLTNPAIQQLFGDDVTFALLAPDIARLQTDPEAEGKRRLIAFGSSVVAESADKLACLTLGSFSKETVNGVALTRILLDNNECLYSHAKDGVIILSFSPETIVTALKQKGAGGSLSTNPAFVSAKKFWAESAADPCSAKFYANPQQASRIIATSSRPEAKKAVLYLQGIQSVSSVAVIHQGDMQVRSKADYDPAKLHETVRKQHQLLRANSNLALHLLTRKTLLYSWFSGLNESLFASADLAQYQAMDTAVREQLGLSIQDMLTAVGPQAGLTLGDVVSTGLFPLPKLVLFAQIQQPEAARKLTDRLRQKMAERGLAEKVTEFSSHPIYYWNLLPTDAAHPALALTGQMLYFANGEATLKALLAEEGKGLPQSVHNVFGPELTAKFNAANSLAFTVRPALLSVEAQKAATWAAMAFSASTSQSAEKLRAAFVNLMQSLDFVAGWTHAEEDHADSVLVFRRNAV
ncbi:hypothetical protein VU06_01955 [Desulfobulbus sp. F3]|nr:hypothetical protein [Desulfobulbus sp. F3]